MNVAHFSLNLPASRVNVIAGATGFTTMVTTSSTSGSSEAITLKGQSLNANPLQCSNAPSIIQPGESSTVTVGGMVTSGPNPPGYRFGVSGASGNDTSASGPMDVNLQDFQITAVYGQTLVGADTGQGTIQYFSVGGYSTPVTLKCTADHGVQCSIPDSAASGTNGTNFILTGWAHLAAGTMVVPIISASGNLTPSTTFTCATDPSIVCTMAASVRSRRIWRWTPPST